MESDEVDKTGVAGTSTDDIDSRCAVNTLILDYYKKFGRKRDLEQFFSLSTAQSDIKDTSGLFWRKMKSENDSSDSGGRRSDSSAHELCRISIKCSMPEPYSSQSDDPRTKTESPNTESPPIITEEAPADISRQTDDESLKSDDNHSQKSFDPLLDLSAHKPLSPTSSITSQRKLEWDSLADVGYGNESDRKTSASSLSTLERLALKQQYSNNDANQDIGPPTCHSTPVDENEGKSKTKKGPGKKMTKIIKKDVDFVEVNVPHTSDTNPPQSINVNLTKHISFNVEKDGGITFDNIRKDINVSPEKVSVETEVKPHLPVDKEIQTSLPKTKDKSSSSMEEPKPVDINIQKIPVLISLNTLRKRLRKKKTRVIRRKLRSRTMTNESKEITPQEKSGEQLSEAESFEYMPGHIYNQNQMKANEVNESRPDHNSTAGNKSSLESSGGTTTDSSKGSKHSLTKDLEKCIEVLKMTLQNRYDDSEVKKRLIKEIVQRLLHSKYRDDETTTDFLSGLSFNSKKLDLKGNNTTTSTSEANNTDDRKHKVPKKSILRMEKFDSNVVASTSQSAPNLFTAASSEKINTALTRNLTSNTESDESSRGKTSSDNALPKTSSEEFYLKYLEALRREESYKRHLKDKEMFLKQKLGSSDTAIKAPSRQNAKINNRLKDLMKDLTRNNYDDGSGDASKLEGGSSDRNLERVSLAGRSHSVFTLSSSLSDAQKKPNLRKKMQVERDFDAGSSKNHYCCCPHHSPISKVGYVDSSVQVNIKCQYDDGTNEKPTDSPRKCLNCQKCERSPRCVTHVRPDHATGEIKHHCEECYEKLKHSNQSGACQKCIKYSKYTVCTKYNSEISGTCQKYSQSPRNITRMVPDKNTGDIKYVCVCKEKPSTSSNTGEYMIYKCSKLTNRGIQFEDPANEINTAAQCGSCKSSEGDGIQLLQAARNIDNATDTNSDNASSVRKCSQSSQTNLLIKMMYRQDSDKSSEPEPMIVCETSSREPVNSRRTSIVEAMSLCGTSSGEAINLCGTSTRCIVAVKDKTPGMIHEATRCLQTEISIDPKISDPSLSDIIIINNCAELISEQHRKIVINTTESTDQRKSFSDVYTSSESGKFLVRPGDGLISEEIKYSDMNIVDETIDPNIAHPEKAPNDYAIPIKGTNMTLRVTLAARGEKEIKEQVNQGVGTDKTMVDQSTCIAEECSKSAQCQGSSAANSTKNTSSSTDHSSNKGSLIRRTSPKKSCMAKPSTSKSPQRNTYPKTVQLKEKKPLLRSNTDTGKLETRCGFAQTEPLNKFSPTSPKKQPEFKATTSGNCCQVRETDKNTLRTGRRRSKEEYLVDRKEIGIQKDLSGDESKKSSAEVKSKCVGSQSDISRKDTGSSCHIDVEEKVGGNVSEKAACGNCGSEGECKCSEEKDQGSIPKKNSCRSEDASQCGNDSDNNSLKDPIINMIQDITRRYSKNDLLKMKKKKCFSEIMTVLNYLLETEDSTDQEPKSVYKTPISSDSCGKKSPESKSPGPKSPGSKSPGSKSPGSKSPGSKSPCCGENTKEHRQTSKSPTRVQTRRSATSPIRFDIKKSSKRKPPGCCDKSNRALRQSESESLPSKHDKSVQNSKSTSKCTESSDLPCSTDLPSTSDSTACRILNKIKKECEKYHFRRTKCGRKCEISSSTSINCDGCKKVHHCGCRHKCKRSKTVDKLQKKCVAYNLILQTSESMLSEETVCHQSRPLQNIVVKVPKRKDKVRTETCKETIFKIEKGLRTNGSPRCPRSRSCPKESEMSSAEDYVRRSQQCTVREYLEKNRPDFVENCSERRNCLKFINEVGTNERAAYRDLLSLQFDRQPDLTALSSEQLRQLAQQIGLDIRRKKPAPKFMSEREMKKHSEKIYKTLPEVVQKKEEKKKENVKKTNLLMANIFKKNLQKKTLRGSVNLSNYSTVIKI